MAEGPRKSNEKIRIADVKIVGAEKSEALTPNQPDEFTKDGLALLERARLDNDRRQIKNEILRQLLDARKKALEKILPLTGKWIAFLALLLLLQGFLGPHSWFELSNGIWIAILTGTSVSILGLLLAIVKSVYPAKVENAIAVKSRSFQKKHRRIAEHSISLLMEPPEIHPFIATKRWIIMAAPLPPRGAAFSRLRNQARRAFGFHNRNRARSFWSFA